MTQISIFKNFVKKVGDRELENVIEVIRKGVFKGNVLAIRKAKEVGDKDLKDRLKKGLLAFTVSGIFEGGRTLKQLKSYVPLMVLDFDNLLLEELELIQRKIKQTEYTHAAFISPGGNGMKIIVQVKSSVKEHEKVFGALANFYENLLGHKVDRSGKDLTRLCFFSWDENAFYNTESKTFERSDELSKNDLDSRLEKCLTFTRQKMEYENGGRNNFVYLFASNCNRIGVRESEVLEFSKLKFDLNSSEITAAVKSAYRHHIKEHGHLKLVNQKEEPDEEDHQNLLNKRLLESPYLPDKIFENLPSLLKQGCDAFEEKRERDVFLTGALSVLGGCLFKVSGTYDRATNFPNLYSFIIAPAASGKGALKYAKILGDAYHRQLLEQSREAHDEYELSFISYQQEMLNYKKKRRPNAPEHPEKPPFQVLYIPANSSSAMVIKHLKDSNGTGIICETEADTLGNVLKQDWGGYSDLLRKAFHFEKVSYSRKGNEEFIEIDQPKLAVALSGTPNQILNLIPSAEDGLFSRFLFYLFAVKAKWRDVSPNNNSINLDVHFESLSQEVLEMIHFLEANPTEVHLQSEQWQDMNQTFAQLLSESNTLVHEEANSVIKRMGVILFRIILIFTGIRKYEQKNTDTKVYCTDTDFIAAIQMVEVYREHSLMLFELLPKVKKSRFNDLPNHKRVFYKQLPGDFLRKDAVIIGADLNLSPRSVDRYLKAFLEAAFLEKRAEGKYCKK